MKQRLIELIEAKQDAGIYETPGFQPIGSVSNEELADHLLANGAVVPPVPVGGTMWAVSNNVYHPSVEEVVITYIYLRWDGASVSFTLVTNNVYANSYKDYEVGKSIFFTEEEAQREFAERMRIIESREFCYRREGKK